MILKIWEMPSPLGPITLAERQGALVAILFSDERHPFPRDGAIREQTPTITLAERQLAEYFSGKRRNFDLPLAPEGTPFQLRVWDRLLHIPFGETLSYGKLASELGDKAAVRAVGAANGRNPLSIVIPCHRVIGADGKLVGYGGGIERKRWLLDWERGRGPLFSGLAD